jgi:hypothetical protein
MVKMMEFWDKERRFSIGLGPMSLNFDPVLFIVFENFALVQPETYSSFD